MRNAEAEVREIFLCRQVQDIGHIAVVDVFLIEIPAIDDRRPQADLPHDSLVAGDFDDITDLERAFKQDEQTGNDISKQVFLADTDCHAYYSRGSSQNLCIDTDVGQPDTGHDNDCRIVYQTAQQPGDRLTTGITDLADQLKDEMSLHRWFKEVIRIRNAFPVIARGLTKNAGSLSDGDVAAFYR